MRRTMNILFLAALGLITIFFGALPVSAGERQTSPPQKTERASPFRCNTLALSLEIRKRHFDEIGPALLKLKKTTRELADGYEFEFPGDSHSYQLLTEWIFQERLCCPFFNIELRCESEDGPLWLRLTGQPGTKEFIKTDAPEWISS
jgi:hypothetical protein